MHKRIVTLLAGSILLAGCTAPFTEAPTATNFKQTDQNKFQSAAHWQVIANDSAAELIKTLPSGHPPLYIKQTAEDSKFQKAFNQKLMQALLAKGYPVMKGLNTPGTLEVEVKTDYVRWKDRPARDPIMGEMTTLAGGLWVLRNIGKHTSAGAAMMGAAVSADVYFAVNSKYAKGPRPKHELVVSTTVSSSDRFYANVTNVYYTTEKDFHNYATQLAPTRLPVKGY